MKTVNISISAILLTCLFLVFLKFQGNMEQSNIITHFPKLSIQISSSKQDGPSIQYVKHQANASTSRDSIVKLGKK